MYRPFCTIQGGGSPFKGVSVQDGLCLVSVSSGGCLCQGDPNFTSPVDRQTPVKILPCPKLRLQAGNNANLHVCLLASHFSFTRFNELDGFRSKVSWTFMVPVKMVDSKLCSYQTEADAKWKRFHLLPFLRSTNSTPVLKCALWTF